MKIDVHVKAIQTDLASAASLGGDEIHEAARRLADALETSLGLRLLDVVNDAALGLSAVLPHGHVEVRLAGREPELVFVDDAPVETEPLPGDDTSARITLRLPEALKTSIETASAAEGVSVNAWVVRALARSLDSRAWGPSSGPRQTPNRLQGFARS